MNPETRLVNKIVRYLKKIPCSHHLKMHGSQYARKGTPDILFSCLSFKKTGKEAFFFEVKPPGEKPTAAQCLEIERWRQAGVHARVVYSVDDVVEEVEFRAGLKVTP